MSILLEALRKSEEQRRLGETPSIHSPSGETPAAGMPGPAWIPAVLVAVSALAMAWFGWEQYRAPETVTSAAVAPAVSDGSAVAALAEGKPEPSAVTEPAPGAEAGGESASIQKPGLVAAPRPSRRTPVESFQADSPTTGKPTNPTATPAGRPRNSRANQAVQQYAEAPGSPPDAGAGIPTTMAEANAMASVPVAAEPREQSASTPHQPEPISYWELPQGVRDSMPEMRISVLVYAEQPENRFLLIGGQRLVEGEEYESGVLLEEIRRGGAVFVYRNYRFLVKG